MEEGTFDGSPGVGEGFPGGSDMKNLPAVQETQVPSPGREDPLEKGMATHSSTLAWRIPWTEGPGGLQSMGSRGSDTTEQLHFHFQVAEGTLGRGSSGAKPGAAQHFPSVAGEAGDGLGRQDHSDTARGLDGTGPGSRRP